MAPQWLYDGGDYQELIAKLHKCEAICSTPCPTFETACTITKVAQAYVCKISHELATPNWIGTLESYLVVSAIVPQLWEFHRLRQTPLDWETFSQRNQLIHNSLQEKIRDSFSSQLSFPGWR